MAADFSAVILNILNLLLITPITYYTWLLGKKFGFSYPWKLISAGYIIASLGCIVRIFGEYYIKTSFPNILDIGIILNLFSYVFILIGFIFIYKVFDKEVKK